MFVRNDSKVCVPKHRFQETRGKKREGNQGIGDNPPPHHTNTTPQSFKKDPYD